MLNDTQKAEMINNIYVMLQSINSKMENKLSQKQLDEFFQIFSNNFIILFENILKSHIQGFNQKLDDLIRKKEEDFKENLVDIIKAKNLQ